MLAPMDLGGAGGRPRWLRWGAAIAIGGLAVLLRVVVPWPEVMTDDGIRPPAGADEFYHLRRIEYSVERFPAVLHRDPTVSYPEVGQVVWPPAWDFGIAALARLAGGRGDRARVELVAAWVPPIAGAVTIALVFGIARRRFGATAGWSSALLLAAMPAHTLSSRLGKSDHHVGTALAATWLLAAGMRWLDRSRDAGARAVDWRGAVELGAAFACVLLVWTGSLLHVAITVGVLLIAVLTDRDGPRAVAGARGLAAACAVGALGVAPFALGTQWREYGRFSPLVLSALQPTFLAAGALMLATTAELWRRVDRRVGPGDPGSRSARIAVALGTGGLGLVVASLALPGLWQDLTSGAGWFQEAEDFQSRVLELRSMWAPDGRFTVGVVTLLFTPFALLAFGTIPWLAWRAARGQERPGAWLLAVWSAAFLAASSLQIRFSSELSVMLALVSGFAIARCAVRFPRAVPVAAVALALATAAYANGDAPANWRRALRGEALPKISVDARVATLVPFARWLGAHSPETAGWLDPDATPEYGVLAPWGQGHLVRYYARRAMVQDNFGVYGGRAGYEAAERYFAATDEDAAKALLDAFGVRYVLASPEGSGHGGPYGPLAMARRLALHRGLEARDRGPQGPVDVPALAHHRLLHEVDWEIGVDEGHLDPLMRAAAAYRWFEVVEGARVEGRATPGARVEAQLGLTTDAGLRLRYRSATRADPGGRYHLVLPYPTGGVSAMLSSEGAYVFRSARASGRLAVPDAAIREGRRLPGPALD